MTGETGKMAEIGCEWALFCRNGRSVWATQPAPTRVSWCLGHAG